MFTHLKICGITRLQDALKIAELGVSFLGFNFYERSPRFVTPGRAREIIRQLPAWVNTVGILVRPTLRQCLQILKHTEIKFLQIYDPLDFTDFNRLPAPVIAAFRLKDGVEFSYQMRGEQYVLLDAFHSGVYGGTGRTLNWLQLPAEVPRERLFLAGGINPDNILKALTAVNPAVIDVASGAECAPGVKDLEKVRAMQMTVLSFNLAKIDRAKQNGNN